MSSVAISSPSPSEGGGGTTPDEAVDGRGMPGSTEGGGLRNSSDRSPGTTWVASASGPGTRGNTGGGAAITVGRSPAAGGGVAGRGVGGVGAWSNHEDCTGTGGGGAADSG